MNVTFGTLVESRGNDLGIRNLTTKISHFFGPLVNQQHDKMGLWVVHPERPGDALLQNRFTRSRRSDDQAPLSEPDRGNQIHNPHGNVIPLHVGLGFQVNSI